MKTVRYFILLTALAFLASSCGEDIKDSIPGLTVPLNTGSRLASTIQGIHTSNNLSSDVFMILGPLGSLIGSGAASVSAAAIGTSRDGTLEFISSYNEENGYYVKNVDNLSTKGTSHIYFLRTVTQDDPPKNDNILYLEIKWALNFNDPNQLAYVYQGKSVTSSQTEVKETLASAGNFTSWLPGPWRNFTDNEPINTEPQYWLQVEDEDFVSYDITNSSDIINTFLKNELSRNYNGIAVITNAVQGDRTINTFSTVDRGAGIVPTDEDPAHQKGYGTVTFADGKVLQIKDYDILIGANGPIGGTIETVRNDGYTTTMTYNEDNSAVGEISKDGDFIADVILNADGTGNYTDFSGMTYPIN